MSIAHHLRAVVALAALLVVTPQRAHAQFDVLSKKMTDKLGSVGGEHAPVKPAPVKSRAKPASKAAAEQGAGEIPGTQPDSALRADSVPRSRSTVRPRHAAKSSRKAMGTKAARPRTGARAP